MAAAAVVVAYWRKTLGVPGVRHGRPDRSVAAAGRAKTKFDIAELGAIAHLYRGEVYRSTIWRTRLDQTTNWAVVTTGLAMSLTFSGPYASPLPLILVGLLVVVFLLLESRRYRYFNVWRARCRLMETDVYGPMLRGEGVTLDGKWNTLLASDYDRPRFHISYWRAIGRRLRSNYAYILAIQAIAYYGKLAIHPVPAGDLARPSSRARRSGRCRGSWWCSRRGLPRLLGGARDRHAADREALPRRGAADLDRLSGRRAGPGGPGRGRRSAASGSGRSSSAAPPMSSKSSWMSNSAAASASAWSSWMVLPEACSSASSGLRATLTVIVASTSGWRTTLTGCRPSSLIGWSSTTWRRSRREAAGGGGVGDVAGGDRAVERAAVGGGANHHEGLAVELARRPSRPPSSGLEVAGLELGAVGLEALEVGLGGAQRLALGQEEVAGVAVLDGDDLAHLAELGDPLEEYDLHGGPP